MAMVSNFYVRNLFLYLLLFVSAASFNEAKAQSYFNYNWYFGNSPEAIIFNKFDNDPLIVSDQATPFGFGGSAVATDAISGQLLFYADGQNIYDASHSIMLGGNGISGFGQGNQPVGISPIPGESGRYYVFSNSANFNNLGASAIQYSIVDMNLPGNAGSPGQTALGAVAGGSKNLPTGINQTSEGMIVIEGSGPGQYWLVTYNQQTNILSTYAINAGGSFVSTSTLAIPNMPIAANLSYSDAAGSIALSPQDGNKNISIIDFDSNTGTLTFNTEINNSSVNDMVGEAIFDTEWSPDGTKLYISRHGNATSTPGFGDLYQFDFNSPGNTLVSLINGPIYRSYGLKLGPDGRIYHLYQTSQFDPGVSIGRLNFPDSTSNSITGVGYEIPVLNATLFNAQQFPEFAPEAEILLTLDSFTILDTCLNTSTKFFPDFTDDPDEPQPDNFVWDFGIPGTGAENYIAPIVTYPNSGSFNVSLTVTAGGASEFYTEPVTIINNMLQVNLGNDTTICPGETLELNPDPQGATGTLSYGWSTEETSPTITVDSAGTYWVVVTDSGTGCDAYDAITVRVYGDEEQTGNYWYFGNGAGIDFNEMPPVALGDGAQTAPEGAATISDANGDLLFYTDGETVYNRDHNIMPGGTDINLGGTNGSTQSSMIVPFPGDETMYYIFTTDAVFGDGTYNMRYSIVDLKEDAPRGKVTVKGKPLFTRSTEKITATAPGGTTTWVLGHEFGNNTFRVYPIDTLGIRQPVLSSVGAVHNNSIELNGQGYMKLAGDNTKLAVSIPGNPNIVEIFDFDSNTGAVANVFQLDLMQNGFVYGLEFSPSVNKLFVTINQGGSSVLQEYAFDSLRTDAALINEQTISASLGAIQNGPDGQTYVAVDGAASLGTITVNDDSASVSAFNLAGFTLAGGTTSRLGLPNMMPLQSQPPMQPALSFTPACVNQEMTFTGTGTSDIDEYFWTFGDGNTSDEQNPMHTYQAPGIYDVALNISNRCGFDTTIVAQVEAFAPPTTLGSRAESICNNDLSITASDDTSPDLVFVWTSSLGGVFPPDRIITVTQPALYTVTVLNANGCSETDTIQVVDGRPPVDLGPDQTYCQDEVIQDLDAQNPNASIIWYINGMNQNNPSRLQSVDTSVDGNFEYVVSVQDALTGCIRLDTLNITVNPAPDITVVENPTSGCALNDGSFDITITGIGAETYSYDLTGPDPQSGSGVGAGVTNLMNLSAGIYNLVVTNDLTNCVVNQTNLEIIDGSPTFTIDEPATSLDLNNLCNDDGRATFTLIQGGIQPIFNITYNVYDGTGNLYLSGGDTDPEGDNIFTINGFEPGDYTIEITSQNGCLQTTTVSFPEQPITFNISGPTDACSNVNAIWRVEDGMGNPFIDPDFQIEWSTTTGSIAGPTDVSTAVLTGIGTHMYYVTVNPLISGFCPTTDSIEVTIQDAPIVTFSTSGDICDGLVQLTANVENALPGEVFTFNWLDPNFPNVGTINVGPTPNPVAYGLQVGSNLRTCVANADTIFQVNEPIEIVITPEQACDDGSSFLIVASANLQVDWSWELDGVSLGVTSDTLIAVDEGLYTVTGTTPDCSQSSSVNITRAPFTEGDLPEDVVICPADPNPDANSVLLDPGPGFVSYEWILNGNVTTAPTFLADQAGTLEVNLTNSFNCVDSRIIEIQENCIPRISAPNAFSPNGNGQNEQFSVFTTFVTKFEILIYNRWGEMVFHSQDKDFGWDGRVNGNPAPIGTYAYVIRFESEFDNSGKTHEQRGGVSLIR